MLRDSVSSLNREFPAAWRPTVRKNHYVVATRRSARCCEPRSPVTAMDRKRSNMDVQQQVRQDSLAPATKGRVPMHAHETFYEVMRRHGITRRSFLKFCSLTNI